MSRVRHAVSTRKRRKKVLKQAKGYRGVASKRYRSAKQQLMRSGQFAYRDRRTRKRDFRRLWVVRINAAARQNGLPYGRFIHGLTIAGIELDRKVLADIAVRDPEAFARIAERAEAAAAG